MMSRRTPIGILLALSVGACMHTTQPEAMVRFSIDAPFCGMSLPVQLSIDGTIVVTDTFRVHLASSRTTSDAFILPSGTHTLGARVPVGYVWADTSVTLAPGESFTRTLPFYCS